MIEMETATFLVPKGTKVLVALASDDPAGMVWTMQEDIMKSDMTFEYPNSLPFKGPQVLALVRDDRGIQPGRRLPEHLSSASRQERKLFLKTNFVELPAGGGLSFHELLDRGKDILATDNPEFPFMAVESNLICRTIRRDPGNGWWNTASPTYWG